MREEKTNPNENLEFRKIPSLKFLYEINSNGTIMRNVKSKRHLLIKCDKHHSTTGKGYMFTFIHVGGRHECGKTIRLPIHRLVAECWIGPKPDGLELDHIDRDSCNNDYRNLRYVTHSEQMKNRVLGAHVIAQATKNVMAHVASISKPVDIVDKDGVKWTFPSITKCAEYIAEKAGVKSESVRSKLKKHRKYILGYDVIYQNAETVRSSSKEQETVQN